MPFIEVIQKEENKEPEFVYDYYRREDWKYLFWKGESIKNEPTEKRQIKENHIQ